MNQPTVKDVKSFWEENPLFTGESNYPPGSKEFFDEHTRVYYDDCFASEPIDRFIPLDLDPQAKVLDLGCGVGFWSVEIQRKGFHNFSAADLTENALSLTSKRLALNDLTASLSIQNAEHLTYPDGHFDHVNCQGVIHHTPDTQAAIREIARVLTDRGTASISVYYRNVVLRTWPFLSQFGKILHAMGFRLRGRGRDSIFLERDVDEITRLYDGMKNPVGKSYTKKEILAIVSPYFNVDRVFLFFFPARAFPVPVPRWLHRWLSNHLGFMIHLSLTKK